MPKILEPDGAEIFALKAYLITKKKSGRKNLSFIMDKCSTEEICLEPSKARNFSRICRELAGKLITLADQADGTKFAHK